MFYVISLVAFAVWVSSFPTSRLVCTDDTIAKPQTWHNHGRNLNGSRWNPRSKISPNNVATLVEAWSFANNGTVSAIPAFWGNRVFFADDNFTFWCLDAVTGKPLWNKTETFKSRTTPVVAADVVIFGSQGHLDIGGAGLVAFDTKTGNRRWTKVLTNHQFGTITQSGTRVCNILYVGTGSTEEFAAFEGSTCCNFTGTFFALDLTRNGSILWQTPMTTIDYPGAAIWGSSPAVSLEDGAVYIGTGDHYILPPTFRECLGQPNATAKGCKPATAMGDSIVALDLYTGKVKWAFGAWPEDAWNILCNIGACPNNVQKNDYDFAQGPMVFTTKSGKKLVGAGNKGGIFYALERSTGAVAWKTRIGPGSSLGGMEWGSATDNKRIYVALSNALMRIFTLPDASDICYGAFGGLDSDCGTLQWLVGDPSGSNLNATQCAGFMAAGGVLGHEHMDFGQTPIAFGPVSVANDVVFGTSLNGWLFAFHAVTGETLWSWKTPDNSSLATAPAIIDDQIFFGTGYVWFFSGAPIRTGTTFYSFKLPSLSQN